ncbi:hypothetical protein EYF80_026026 [Liparis tanakae]|uniref:Uncharacterized protein n=1 Tax=Liparis tanakae TaxID=230148 RepID=A0A4Z2HCZ9_9TELE|nr:hypothetical protein EYF80_026026 [Liparis tanakae]
MNLLLSIQRAFPLMAAGLQCTQPAESRGVGLNEMESVEDLFESFLMNAKVGGALLQLHCTTPL